MWETQIQKLGGSVRKGVKSQMVVFWKQIPVKEQNSQTDEIKESLIPILCYYNVFHIDQCEGICAVTAVQEEPHSDEDADSIIRAYLDRTGVTLIQRIGDEAYYSPSRDCVVLPAPEQFKSIEDYIYFYNHARFQKRLHCMTPIEFHYAYAA